MKYIVCDRKGGLGDILANIYSCWLIAKEFNRGLIIDCRETPYNWFRTPYDDVQHVPINNFECIFLFKNEIGGVKFYLPSHIDDYMFRPTSKNYWSKDDLISIDRLNQNDIQNNKYLSSKHIDLLNSSIKFLRSDVIFYNMLPYVSTFFDEFELNNTIKEKINTISSKYDFTNTCGFHIRYGNNSETTNPRRYPGWRSISTIFEDIDKIINLNKSKYNNFFICSDTQLIIDKFINRYNSSFSISTTHGNYGDIVSLLNHELCPIKLIQEAFLDMYFLKKCKHIYITNESMFTLLSKYIVSTTKMW